MIRTLFGTAFVGVAVIAGLSPVWADRLEGIDAKSLALLRKVGTLYKDAKAVSADVAITGAIESDGQEKVEVKLQGAVAFQRPNSLAIRTSNPTDPKAGVEVVSDGKELSMLLRRTNQYAQRRAPEALFELGRTILPLGQHTTGILFQNILADDPADQLLEGVTEGKFTGTVKVGDKEAHHMVFKQPSLDWELWVAAEGQPFVLKMKGDLELPNGKITTSETYTNWKLNPELEKDRFAFKAPAGARKVERLGRAGDDD